MLPNSLKSYNWLPVILILLAVVFGACTSRYRLDLFQVADGERKKVKIEQTQYVPGTVLSMLNGEIKVVPGDGNVVVVTTGTRGGQTKREVEYVLSFDEYLRCRLHFQLAWPLKAGTVDLPGNAYLQLMGQYEWPPDARIFSPESGQLVVDSVTSKNLYATVNGLFRNNADMTYEFDGSFKVKISD
jgi:hypothetical protein